MGSIWSWPHRFARRQKQRILEQLQEAELRPCFGTAAIAAFEVVLAANDARRGLILIVGRAEAAEADHLVDDEARRHLAARDDEHSRLPIRGRRAAEERLQIDDGQELTAQVRDAAKPRLGAGDARDLLGYRQHLANVGAARHEALGPEPKTD